MSVPDYQTLMLPIMERAADGADHRIAILVQELSDAFKLSEADRDLRIASGQAVIYNRTHWAVTYLVKTRLLERSARGTIRITQRGRGVLAEKPERIDVKLLGRFPELAAFRAGAGESSGATPAIAAEPAVQQTPDEVLDATFTSLRHGVEGELLDHVLASPPDFFEQLVVDLLVAMGYGGSQAGAARRVGRTGDDGIDGVIDEDKLGLDAVYIQAKRWDPSHPVRRPDVQAFAGSLEGQRAGKGVFITTSRFTDDAREYVQRISKRIVLIDGHRLTELMYDHGIGVRDQRSYQVRRVDAAYFEGEL